jgi:large subunit ribosomal protein L4e
MSRPQVTIFSADGTAGAQAALPAVFTAPIRPDVVNFVHTNVRKNKRQAYGHSLVKDAGMNYSAASWGTGRAVARIPRVAGGGTHASGSGAFGNMCRGGRMFAPTRVWRRWHRKVSVAQRRYAVASALAASAIPALVMARGHRVSNVQEIPIVVSDDVQAFQRTKQALALLKALGLDEDLAHVTASKKLRQGKGKMRNRRYVQRKGPLVIYSNDQGLTKAFRNIPGVETCHVERLNLLTLAPGGHVGRLLVWTESAFAALDKVFGTFSEASSVKSGFKVPQHIMADADLARVINSDEVQSVINAPKQNPMKYVLKRNPLRNRSTMLKLNPYHAVIAKAEEEQRTAGAKRRADGKITANKKAKYAMGKKMAAQKARVGATFKTEFSRA